MTELPNNKLFWQGLLRRVIHRTRGSVDAEDCLHDAYIRLANARATQEVENPAGFLVQTSANISVDNFRRGKLFEDWNDCDMLVNVCDSSPLQDEVLEARDRLKHVGEGLERLAPRTREVFLMHRIDGMKYREISAQLGISQSAVEKHVARAVLFLIEWTQDWGKTGD